MRHIKYIIIHCSDSPDNMDIGVAEIRRWHKEKGWADVGYHFIIKRNGEVQNGRDVEIVGSHCQGYNSYSIGICLVGGRYNSGKNNIDDISHYTPEQIMSLKQLVFNLKEKYPEAEIKAHRDFNASKTCPNFNIKLLEV